MTIHALRSVRFRVWIVVCAVALTFAGTVRADDTSLQELKARIEALEKQNKKLMDTLEKQAVPPSPGMGAPVNAESFDKKQVQTIVDEYFKEQDGKKKKAEELKKKEAEDAGFEVGKSHGMTCKWDYGLWAETADKAFKVHVGGRTQVDGAWMTTSDRVMFGPGGIGTVEDAVNFRRARFQINGTMYETMDFLCEYDFINTVNADPGIVNTPVPTDLWLTFTHLPYVGNFRMGNQKPPVGFEHLTSSRFLNFMERSLGFDAFIENQDNGFEPGVSIFNWTESERATWALGMYKYTRNITGWNIGDGEYQYASRVTYLPWWENDGRCLLHMGLGGFYANPDENESRYRTRILVRNGPAALHNIIAEARFISDGEMLLQPELVYQNGPFLLQSEFTSVWTQNAVFPRTPIAARRALGTAYYQAYYCELLYFLTGEHRAYDRKAGVFTRVIPQRNAFRVLGNDGCTINSWGAWQVGLRYSYIDLQDKGINGGGTQPNGATINDITLGLNWFLNPNAKIQWNYSWAYRSANGGQSNGSINAFGTRLAFDF